MMYSSEFGPAAARPGSCFMGAIWVPPGGLVHPTNGASATNSGSRRAVRTKKFTIAPYNRDRDHASAPLPPELVLPDYFNKSTNFGGAGGTPLAPLDRHPP